MCESRSANAGATNANVTPSSEPCSRLACHKGSRSANAAKHPQLSTTWQAYIVQATRSLGQRPEVGRVAMPDDSLATDGIAEPADLLDPRHYAQVRRQGPSLRALPLWCYTSPSFFEAEMERVFRPSWNLL